MGNIIQVVGPGGHIAILEEDLPRYRSEGYVPVEEYENPVVEDDDDEDLPPEYKEEEDEWL